MIRLGIILLSLFLMGGCSTPSKNSTVNKSLNKEQGSLLSNLLRKEFRYWQGTPYRLSGNSKKGIDCSAFVQNVYTNSFNVQLPRTTEKQAQQGYFVDKNKLQLADLVFFKTGFNIRHVGIYIGNNEFIHASKSKGVITSSLNNVYWKKNYWQAKRILK
jgi:cell wall-associated NlpC family hydrolase